MSKSKKLEATIKVTTGESGDIDVKVGFSKPVSLKDQSKHTEDELNVIHAALAMVDSLTEEGEVTSMSVKHD